MTLRTHIAFVALAAILLVTVSALPAQAASDEPMGRLSDEQMAELHQLFGPESKDEAMQLRLREIVETLKPHMRHPKIAAAIKPHVFEHEALNAFAVPDGTLVVLSGLMEATDGKDDMLMATVAHELAHIDCQHGRPNLGNILIDIVIKVFGGDIGKLVSGWLQGKRSQKHEFEADRVGMEYMLRAGHLPDGALRLQKEFTTRFGSGLGVASYFQSHPPGPARIRALQEAVPRQLLELGQSLAPTWRPRTGVVLAGDFGDGDFAGQFVEKMNHSAQMRAQPLALLGDANPQAALAEAENVGLDLVLWCEPLPPSESGKPAPGVSIAVYDVPTGLPLLDRALPRHDKKALATPETLALALLANRNWQCGGAPSIMEVPLAPPTMLVDDVAASTAVVRLAHNSLGDPSSASAPAATGNTAKPRVADPAPPVIVERPPVVERKVDGNTDDQAGGVTTGAPGDEVGGTQAGEQLSRPETGAHAQIGSAYRDPGTGTRLVPIRAVVEAFGGHVRAGAGPGKLSLELGDRVVTLTLGEVLVAGTEGPARLSCPPKAVGTTGYAPLEIFKLLLPGMTDKEDATTIGLTYGGTTVTLTLAE